jgi:hypothetical protein
MKSFPHVHRPTGGSRSSGLIVLMPLRELDGAEIYLMRP